MTNKTLIIIANLLILFGLSTTVLAQSQSSPSYRIDESTIGPGGNVESSSASYQESSTLGDTGVGEATGTAYSQVAGFNTTNEPRLRLTVNTPTVSFGPLSTAATVTATATFSVLNYTSFGYSVYNVGSAPTTGGHSLAGINPEDSSQVGTEQFGLNLRLNSLPVVLGAEPLQVPSGSFSFGQASPGYDVQNQYRFTSGEKIAQSNRASGQTDYTISYVVNISNSTPGGQYTAQQGLVVIGTY